MTRHVSAVVGRTSPVLDLSAREAAQGGLSTPRAPRHVLRAATLALAIGASIAGFAQAEDTPEQLLIQQGYYWQAKEHPERAEEAWQRLLDLSPTQPDALYGLGLIALQREQPQAAADYLARLMALQPVPRQALQLQQDIALAGDEPRQQLERARELADAGDREQAVALYRQLFDGRTPQGLIAREYYNTLGFLDADWPEARRGLERLRRERPDDVVLDLFLALHLARREDSRAEGIRALARLSHNPDIGGNADETWRFALQWMGAPSRDQVPLFREYLQAHPDDTEIRALLDKGLAQGGSGAGWRRDPHVTRGLQALDAGDLQRAESELQARLREQPRDYDALGAMGVLRQHQQRLAEAEDYLQRAVAQPEGGRWRTALADVRYWMLLENAEQTRRRGQEEEAARLIDQAIAQNPREPAGPTARASLQARRQHLAEAEAGYRAVLREHPGYPDAIAGLVNLLSQDERPEQALAVLDGLSPEQRAKLPETVNIDALRAVQVARLAERRGDLEGAQKAYRQALALTPQDAWTRFALARVLLRSGQPQAARDLVDAAVQKQPEDADALFSSALLSAELGEWFKAQRTLAKIPPAQRSAAVGRLYADARLHVQAELAEEMARRGQRQEAWALLERAAPLAGDSPERIAVLAAAYARSGNPQQAERLMNGLLAGEAGQPDIDLRLLQVGVLMECDEDARAAEQLRALQGRDLDSEQRRRFDDLRYRYRVRQADRLRQRNDLVAAYDVLSPALAERPHDALAVTALARMYSASGNGAKASALYQPLLAGDPQNAGLHLSLADIAVQNHDRALAERSLKQALALEPEVPATLTHGARIYRGLGQTGEARKLAERALQIEQREQLSSTLNLAGGSPIVRSDNPFVGLPGQRSQSTGLDVAALIPEAVESLPATAAGPAPRTSDADDTFYAAAEQNQPSPARQTLDEIAEENTGYVRQGLTVRNNNNDKGLGKLTDIETPFEIGLPLNEDGASLALQVTPVWLQSGKPGGFSPALFGGSGLDAVGRQDDQGTGFALAYRDRYRGLQSDLGVSPLGFTYSTVVGGISLQRPFEDAPETSYKLSLSRRPVTDSLTSFAGSKDARSGLKWGGVTANGVRAELSHDDQRIGLYGYAAAHRLLGTHVEDNDRIELGAGIYRYLVNDADQRLTLGLSATALHYRDNQNFYTYGHGGYFSPQKFFSLGVPLNWAQRRGDFSYRVDASLGVQYIDQDSAEIFPGHGELQARANALGLDQYDGDSKTGIGYALSAAGEYRLSPNLFFGGALGLNNSSDYTAYEAGLYLRYTFEDVRGAMPLPVTPFTSPYSQSN